MRLSPLGSLEWRRTALRLGIRGNPTPAGRRSLHGRRGKPGCPEAPFPAQARRRGLAEGAVARRGLGGSRLLGMQRSQPAGAAGLSGASVPGRAKSLAYAKLDVSCTALGFRS